MVISNYYDLEAQGKDPAYIEIVNKAVDAIPVEHREQWRKDLLEGITLDPSYTYDTYIEEHNIICGIMRKLGVEEIHEKYKFSECFTERKKSDLTVDNFNKWTEMLDIKYDMILRDNPNSDSILSLNEQPTSTNTEDKKDEN